MKLLPHSPARVQVQTSLLATSVQAFRSTRRIHACTNRWCLHIDESTKRRVNESTNGMERNGTEWKKVNGSFERVGNMQRVSRSLTSGPSAVTPEKALSVLVNSGRRGGYSFMHTYAFIRACMRVHSSRSWVSRQIPTMTAHIQSPYTTAHIQRPSPMHAAASLSGGGAASYRTR